MRPSGRRMQAVMPPETTKTAMNPRNKFLTRHIIPAAAMVAATVVAATPVRAEKLMDVGDNATVGIYVYDLKGDSVVVANNAGLGMTPASILKSLTTATAIQTLGMNHRFGTSVLLSGMPGKDGSWNGDLIVRPNGDPTLESRHFPQYAGLCDTIVCRLQQNGLSNINGRIIVADTISDQGPVGKWEIQDTPYGYGAGWFNLNWMDNVFTLNTGTGETTPHIPDLQVIKIKRRGTDIQRGAGSEKLYIYGPTSGKNSRRSVSTTMPNPYKAFVHLLKEKLTAAGIGYNDTTPDEDAVENASKCPARHLYTHLSPTSGEIMRSLMWRSDNMYAEGMLRALTPEQSRDSALVYEADFWRNKGLDIDRQIIYDGSGLTRANSVTPSFMGRMLNYMAKSPYAADYVSLFPVAGRNGTVRNLLKDTPLAGKLVLKSGSVNNVRTYCGFAVDENKMPTHAVVIMVNKYTVPGTTVRDEIGRVLLDILHGHCGIGAEAYDPALDDAEAE